MIYFQVIDRNLRNFLNALMPRLPFHVAAGETPPGLTDFVIFYDPLVNPTRPGRILPASLVSLLDEGRPMEAERILIGVIADALRESTVEHDGELEMLTIEEEEHRVRVQEIQNRRARLAQVCEGFGAALDVLKNWKPEDPAPPDSAPAMAPVPSASGATLSPAADFYAQMEHRVQQIMETVSGGLDRDHFNESFRMTYDLGLLSLPASAAAGGADVSSTAHRVMYVSDWLVNKFSELYQLPKIREIEDAVAQTRGAIVDLETRLARFQQKRREIFYSVRLNLDTELDRLFQIQHHQFQLDARRRKTPFTLEDKTRYERIKEEAEGLERKVDSEIYLRFPRSPEFLSTFRRLNQAIVQSLQEWVRIEEDEREKSEVLSKLMDEYSGSNPEERLQKMQEQLARLRQFSNLLTSRGTRRRPFSPSPGPPWPVSPSQVLAVLDRVQSQDTTLFPEKFLRRRGPPNVLLLPAFGSGLYDWQDGILVISLYPDKLDTAVLAAMAEFRMDADESKELFNHYGTQIRRYKNLGFVKLKEMFISDYTSWLEKEAAGFRVMETDVRSWFERKIPLRPVSKA